MPANILDFYIQKKALSFRIKHIFVCPHINLIKFTIINQFRVCPPTNLIIFPVFPIISKSSRPSRMSDMQKGQIATMSIIFIVSFRNLKYNILKKKNSQDPGITSSYCPVLYDIAWYCVMLLDNVCKGYIQCKLNHTVQMVLVDPCGRIINMGKTAKNL